MPASPSPDCGPEGRHFLSSFNAFRSSPLSKMFTKFQGGDRGEVFGGTRETLTSAEHLFSWAV